MNNEAVASCKSTHSLRGLPTDCQHGAAEQKRRGAERPHPLLTYFVVGGWKWDITVAWKGWKHAEAF